MSHSDWQTKVDEQMKWCRECGYRFVAEKPEYDTCLNCSRNMADAALKSLIGNHLRKKLQK